MSTGVFARLRRSAVERGTLLCIGLDPRLSPDDGSPYKTILEANRRIIGETAEFALAYKPNIAFYEQYGAAGIDALVRTIEMVPDGVFTILDAKRGDIGSTAESYAVAAFETFGADLVTVSPYLGRDSVDPFLRYGDRGVFVLCRTSNPSGSDLQDLNVVWQPVGSDVKLYQRTAALALSWGDNVGLVVAGNDVVALEELRRRFPEAWFLAPGIGAQGGTMGAAVTAGADASGGGILPVVARAVAKDPASAARRFRDEIRAALAQKPPRGPSSSAAAQSSSPAESSAAAQSSPPADTAAGPSSGSAAPTQAADWADPRSSDGSPDSDSLRDRVVRGLFEHSCFQLGEFTLKSGQLSPFYVDLRRAVASPAFMRTLSAAYASLAADIPHDRVAGIPVAALPIATALSLYTGRPMIYPRIPPKAHGTGRPIEGAYEPGERVLLVDDLITTGGSKIEALEVLESEGLHVDHLVVLLERGTRGRADMEGRGIDLRSLLHVEDVLRRGRALGYVTPDDERRILAFLSQS